MEFVEFSFYFVKANILKEGMWISPSFDSPAFCITKIVKGDREIMVSGNNGKEYTYSPEQIVKLSSKKLKISIPVELHEYALLTEYVNSLGGVSLYTIDDEIGSADYMTPYNAEGLTVMSDVLLGQYKKHESKEIPFGMKVTNKDFDTNTLEILEEQTQFSNYENLYSSRVDLTGLSKEKREIPNLDLEDSLLVLDFNVTYTTQVGRTISRDQSIQFVKSERQREWSCSVDINDSPSYTMIENCAEHMGHTLISMGKSLIDNKSDIGNINLNNLRCK